MSGDVLLRPLRASDAPQVVDCWCRSFGDPPETVRRALAAGELLSAGLGAETEGAVRAFMFAFEGLRFGTLPAAYLYALCTQPEYRGAGLAGSVLEALTAGCFARGAEMVCLAPGNTSLSRWYQTRFGMIPLSGTSDLPLAVISAPDGTLCPLTPEEYGAAARDGFVPSLPLLRTQAALCGAGGFFRVDVPGGSALVCAAAETGTLSVRELRCPPGIERGVLGLLARRLRCDRVLLRQAGTALPLLCRMAPGCPPPSALPLFPFSMD